MIILNMAPTGNQFPDLSSKVPFLLLLVLEKAVAGVLEFPGVFVQLWGFFFWGGGGW